MDAAANLPTQHIYRGRGSHAVRVPVYELDDASASPVPTIADRVPVSQIMSREVICAREDLEVAALMELMVRRHIGCVPVINERGRPIGMVTKFDLVEQVQTGRVRGAPTPATAGALMMPLAITLDERASVAHAAALMAIEDVHHVAIVADSGALIGVVSSMDIVRWLAINDGVTSDLSAPP
jgi:CBS domain-containing protein